MIRLAADADATSQVYQAIRAAILDGTYRPLSHLREIPLSEELGVSRTPVRLALKRLARDGFVVLRPNRGAYVAPWDARTLAEVAEVRAHLSLMAGRIAARLATDADLARLARAGAAVAEEIRRGPSRDIDRCAEAMLAFHEEIFRVAGNRLLAELFRQTTYVPVVHRTFHRFTDTDWARIHAYIGQVTDALADRDGECAGALMQAYFLLAKRAILSAGDPAPEAAEPAAGAAATGPGGLAAGA